MPTAIVTGATGITGSAIVHHLCKDDSYTRVFTLSRQQRGQEHPKIKHANLDLLAPAERMADDLAGVAADHVFFCAYLARDTAEETTRANASMLSNFIAALEKTGAIKQLKRFILTCGFKQYGVHLGNAKQPVLEDDPLLEGSGWPPIFYYEQQRVLAQAAARGHWDWVCTLPNDVLGFARGNFMNEATALGLYCSVCKVLPGSELAFPGNKANYLAFNTWTSANVHAQFCCWAARTPGAGNNTFNVINGDTQSFQDLWPRLATRFGCKIPEPMFPHGGVPGAKGFKHYEATTVTLDNRHPIAARASSLGLLSDPAVNEKPTLHVQIDPEKWAQRVDVNAAWEKLRDRYGLEQHAWDKATWDFLTFALGRGWSCVGSMSKARKLGWTGYADTWEELERIFETLEREKILPPAEQLSGDFPET
ncbi:hypothetical protein VTO42DRAFT_4243 [Malbranchea cinnamomea]